MREQSPDSSAPDHQFSSNLFHAIGNLFYSVAKFSSGTVSVHQQLFTVEH